VNEEKNKQPNDKRGSTRFVTGRRGRRDQRERSVRQSTTKTKGREKKKMKKKNTEDWGR